MRTTKATEEIEKAIIHLKKPNEKLVIILLNTMFKT
ncbi:hypothetical protein ICE98_03620 [Lactococcus lactis]|nr:hypothetical protein [Lactococcus lactis]